MQSSLPDVNSSIMRYRVQVISQLERADYNASVGALYALNACMPAEYRVVVSNEKYAEMTKQNYMIVCSKCKTEFNFEQVQVHELLLPPVMSLAAGLLKDKFWFCPNLDCKHNNRLTKSHMKVTKLEANTYLHVMPEPPNRAQGMMGRTRFHIQMSSWIWRFLDELEERLARFRQEYIPNDQPMLEETPEE